MWKAQVYDTDICDWEDSDECQPSEQKSNVEDDVREMKRRCAYPIRVRIVKE